MPDVKMRAHPRHTGLHGYMPSARPHTVTSTRSGIRMFTAVHTHRAARVARVEAAARRKQPQHSVIFRYRFVVVFVCVSAVSAKLGVECWIALATQPLMM